MSSRLIVPLFFTVMLLLTHGYFLFGSIPLLILRHDTPMDGRFVRGFFDIYYRAATAAASAAAVSLWWAGWPGFAAGAAALALLAFALRRRIIPRMDRLRARITENEADAIAAFRRMHVTAVLLNLLQLAVIVSTLIAASMAMR